LRSQIADVLPQLISLGGMRAYRLRELIAGRGF
jgi:hypothetical protein